MLQKEGNFRCIKCQIEKPIADFQLRNPKTGMRRNTCKVCRSEDSHKYYKEHRKHYWELSQEEKCIAKAHVTDNAERKVMEALKIYGLRCNICGESNLLLLQWHHRFGRGKENMDAACRRVARLGKRLDDLILLCSNCHILADIQDKTGKRATRLTRIAERLQGGLDG